MTDSDKMVKTSLAAMVENLTTTEKVITETIVMRVVTTDVVRIIIMVMMAVIARTVLHLTLVLIIMVMNASSVADLAIIIMAVSNVHTEIALMEIMREENVLTAHHVSIIMATVNSVSLLQDLIMKEENSVRSVHAKDNSKVDIASKVADMETIVRVDSASVRMTTIRMLNIA